MKETNTFFTEKNNKQAGYGGIILIVIFIIIAAAIMVISILQQTSESTQQDIQSEEATRLLHTAETGVEEAIANIEAYKEGRVGEIEDLSEVAGSDYTLTVQTKDENLVETVLDEGHTVEVKAKEDNTAIRVRWWDLDRDNNCNSADPAAILASIYKSTGDIATHYAYGPCTTQRANNLAAAEDSVSNDPTSNYYFEKTFPVVENGTIFRVKPLYNRTAIKIEAVSGALETPSWIITSQSASADEVTASQAIRSVVTAETAPSILDFTLVSGTTIETTHPN